MVVDLQRYDEKNKEKKNKTYTLWKDGRVVMALDCNSSDSIVVGSIPSLFFWLKKYFFDGGF